jgi:hypothetical protein
MDKLPHHFTTDYANPFGNTGTALLLASATAYRTMGSKYEPVIP